MVNWIAANWVQIVAAISALTLFARAVAVLLPAKYAVASKDIETIADFMQKFVGRR